MAIVNTSGVLCTSTATTGSMIALGGKAQWIYLSVYTQTAGFFSHDTASTGTGTGIGLQFATGDTYVFQFQPGDAKYFYNLAKISSGEFYITEVF